MTYVSESFWHDAVNKATTDLFTFGYKHIIKPNFVFNHRPDEAHDQMIEFCHVVKNVPPLLLAEQLMLDYTDPILETNVMGVDFTNPFGLSAGLDKNCEMPVVLDHAGFGFETVGSTTSRPCPGNAKPWFHRLPEYDSMMVHVGLANDGSDKVIDRAEQAWTNAKTMQVSVSIARTNDDKCGDLDEGIEDYCISAAPPAAPRWWRSTSPARTRTSANRSPRLRKRSTVCLRRSTRSTARSPRWSRCR